MTIDFILSKYDERIARLASELRKFLLENLDEIQEIPDNSLPIIGYGYGTGYKDMICTIMLSKSGVKLGFNRATELPDPGKILTGTGKLHRYVEIKTADDFNNTAVKALLGEGLKSYAERMKSTASRKKKD